MHTDIVWDWASLVRGKGTGIPRPLACPGDLQTLKMDMMQLLLSVEDDYIKLSDIPRAYASQFLRPLVLPYYGVTTPTELFEKLGQDTFLLYGGKDLSVCLNAISSTAVPASNDATAEGVSTEVPGDVVRALADVVEGVSTEVVKDENTGLLLELVQIGAKSKVTVAPKKSKKRRNRHRRR